MRSIILYLESLGLNFDKKELEFQYQSHPNFPSLLAISDTLNFFNIANKAYKIDKSNVRSLPDSFVASINKKEQNLLVYVEKNDEGYVYIDGSNKFSVDFELFSKLWTGVIFFIPDNGNFSEIKSSNENIRFSRYIYAIVLAFSFLLFYKVDYNIGYIVFFILSFIGFLLSITSLKYLFGIQEGFFAKFCKLGSSVDCNGIINSKKWSLLKFISFSDLSVVFFSTQVLGFLCIGYAGNLNVYFLIQKILLISSFPLIFISLYYQSVIEKKWCSICLLIIGILLIQLNWVIFYLDYSSDLNFWYLTNYVFLSLVVIFILILIKYFVKIYNDFELNQIENNRFIRNYDTFKSSLLFNKDVYTFPSNLINVGNPKANLKLTIITNPFCGFCKDSHYLLEALCEKYKNTVSISFIFNTLANDDRAINVCKNITSVYLRKGEDEYFNIMDKWFKEDKYNKESLFVGEVELVDGVEKDLKIQREWCSENNFTFTPCVFVNGYRYPSSYKIDYLQFYIDELLNDSSIK